MKLFPHPRDSLNQDSLRPSRIRRRRILFWLRAVLILILAFSLVMIIRYTTERAAIRSEQSELSADYHAEETVSPAGTEMPETTVSAAETPETTETPAVTAAPEITEDPDLLPAVTYPVNSSLRVLDSIGKLRRQNSDIVAWLEIDGVLSTAVVQRDNSYYLTRDYKGYHNSNGAVFLDESCDLSTRPYTLILFGHNMKTEEMFGFLHRYEKVSYYREHAFVTFNGPYEEGTYVIFAAGPVNTDTVYLYNLYSDSRTERGEIISALKAQSDLKISLDVSADDQLLLLVTCVDDSDNYRRIVAARRLREGESEDSLRQTVLAAGQN